MKLIEKQNQMRRDFTGLYQCEDCGHEEIHGGCYDDENFHQNVTPNWKCKYCGNSTIDLKREPAKIVTRYPEGEQH